MAGTDLTESSGRSSPWWWISLALLPLLYVLSIGPVAAIVGRNKVKRSNFLETFYAPVIWLHDHTPLQKPLEHYVDWWEKVS